jgi:TPR repeat protein
MCIKSEASASPNLPSSARWIASVADAARIRATKERTMTRELLFLMDAEQTKRFGCLVDAAERGDGGAACILGDLYREGAGGLRCRPKQAYRWYARSALTGDANGQNNLGACHEHGFGCVQSYTKAAKWYRLAAGQELATASMNLGYCHLYGHGVPADRAEALRLFRLAVVQGEPKAADELERLGERITMEPSGADRTEMRQRGGVTFVEETPSLGRHHLGLVGMAAPGPEGDDEEAQS